MILIIISLRHIHIIYGQITSLVNIPSSDFRSMYFDEDGDLAHEFYEEVLPKRRGGTRKMRRVNSRNLVPQVSCFIVQNGRQPEGNTILLTVCFISTALSRN